MSIFSFGLLADLQYANDDPYKNRYFRNSLQKLDRSIEIMNSHNLEFVADLGDLINGDFDSFDPLLQHYKKCKSQVFFTLGNHEYEVEDSLKDQVKSKIGIQGKTYYSFTIKHIRFIFLDGNTVSTYASVPGSEQYLRAEELIQNLRDSGMANARPWNGGIDQDQLEWLEYNLQEAKQKLEKVIIFCHFPIYPANKYNLLNDSELLHVTGRHDHVIAWFNGHNHGGNYGYNTGVHFVTLQGMVETPDDLACCIIDVFSDRLELTGYGREPSRTLSVHEAVPLSG